MSKILRDAFSSDDEEKDPQVSGQSEVLGSPAEDSSDDLLADEPEESDDLLADDESAEKAEFGTDDSLETDGAQTGGADSAGHSEFDSGDSDNLLGGDPDHLNLVQGDLDAEGFDDALAGSEWRGQQDGEPDSPDAVRQKQYGGENHFGTSDVGRMLGEMSAPAGTSDSEDDSAKA